MSLLSFTLRRRGVEFARSRLAAFTLLTLAAPCALAVTLADGPVVYTAPAVPGNLALTPSVEFPTAVSVANLGDYSDASEYLGYFDPRKCYTYQLDTGTPANSYFQPTGAASGANGHSCSGQWSGNFMNWAAMPAIDPFRWALTGGYRSVDTPGATILEKAWASNQGSPANNFPRRGTNGASGHNLPAALISSVTPLGWSHLNTFILNRGNTMELTASADDIAGNNYNNNIPTGPDWTSSADGSQVYHVYIRVKVCDASAGLESNCVPYSGGYKPEGLMQQYANKIRYSVFSYLYADGVTQQGGVMRSSMDYIGPTDPRTGDTNLKAEWDKDTGVMKPNPDSALASDSGVTQSGSMNYLNKFGEYAHSYMTDDNVSELYYAAVRYFENLGNVPEWSANLTPAKLDGFPAPTSWKDPIIGACQRNFILGIGDDNTHYDYNTGGSRISGSRPMPAAVAADTFNKSADWTSAIETLEGLGSRNGAWADQGSEYMAGLAYGAHIYDIRPDLDGTQTISTYWMDVMEGQTVAYMNPYWLASKYGGFDVPAGYTMGTPLTLDQYDKNGGHVYGPGFGDPVTWLQPDNYFMAGSAATMVAGLRQAFSSIAVAIAQYSQALAPVSANVSSTDGVANYASQYNSTGWNSTVTASKLTSLNPPTATAAWSTDVTLAAQFLGTGWDTGRNVVTWNGAGVPFRYASLSPAQKAALDTSYRAGADGADYLNYLRGDRSQEQGSTVTGSSKAYRTRVQLLGDIVNAKLTPVGPPAALYSSATNPGYGTFKTAQQSRTTMVLAAANDGMLHVLNGALSGAGAGNEIFAYVPSTAFTGPNGNAGADGLAALGNPDYEHRFYVDATPQSFDVDFNRAGTTATPAASDWHTIAVGGLGKGGKMFYGIDITNPAGITSESAAAGKVLWEFTDSTMGFSYGLPTMVKTAKYGWTLILTSGYNNADGYGYLYFVNPTNGALLEKVRTPLAAPGLAQASAFVKDYTDGTADAVYAGDLNGQLWRFDISGSGDYPSPKLLFTARDANGAAQPITSAPLTEIYPGNQKRYVLFGTGQLLDTTDIQTVSGQSFYAFQDGTGTAFDTSDASPLTRGDLTPIANPATPPTIPATSKGWYIDLGDGGWRVVQTAVSNQGVVAFSAIQPLPESASQDVCSSVSGNSRVYDINFGTGQSQLDSDADPGKDGYASFSNTITELRFMRSGSTVTLMGGDSTGKIHAIQAQPVSASAPKLYNWREVPVVE